MARPRIKRISEEMENTIKEYQDTLERERREAVSFIDASRDLAKKISKKNLFEL